MSGAKLSLLSQNPSQRPSQVMVEQLEVLLSELAPLLEGLFARAAGAPLPFEDPRNEVGGGDGGQPGHEERRSDIGEGLHPPQGIEEGAADERGQDETEGPRRRQ